MTVLPLERSPITLTDLKVMFKLFSGADGHKREEDDIDVWVTASRAARWTRAEVAAASLTLLANWTGYRIMPGHVTEQITKDRGRIRHAWYCPDPPRELRDDPAAEIAWRRRAYGDFADRALLALATGQPLEDVPMLREIEPNPMISLSPSEQFRRLGQMAERMGDMKAIPAAPRADRRPPLDEDTRRAVRADLAARAVGEEARSAVRAESAAWASTADHEVAS